MDLLKGWIENSKLFNKPDSAAGLSQIQTVYAAFSVCWAVFLVFDWTGIDLPRKRLGRKDTVDWHSRVISSIHAIILCIGDAASSASCDGKPLSYDGKETARCISCTSCDKQTPAGALGCYVELQGVTREALVKGYAIYPDVFARIFLGMSTWPDAEWSYRAAT